MACDKYCFDCIYYGIYLSNCDFYLETGDRRGCEAGKGCTRKVSNGIQKEKKKIVLSDEKKPIKNGKYEVRMQLYQKGLSDKDIAAILGVHTETIANWRRVNLLPPNYSNNHKRIIRG